MRRFTLAPAETVAPGPGICPSIVFSGVNELVSVVVAPSRRPSCSSVDLASASVLPVRSGTCIVAGPRLSVMLTVAGSSIVVPAGGSVAITAPLGSGLVS